MSFGGLVLFCPHLENYRSHCAFGCENSAAKPADCRSAMIMHRSRIDNATPVARIVPRMRRVEFWKRNKNLSDPRSIAPARAAGRQAVVFFAWIAAEYFFRPSSALHHIPPKCLNVTSPNQGSGGLKVPLSAANSLSNYHALSNPSNRPFRAAHSATADGFFNRQRAIVVPGLDAGQR